MEMEQTLRSGPGPGLCGSDREVFERVWRRVMPVDRPDSPIALFEDSPAQSTVCIPPPPLETAPTAPSVPSHSEQDPCAGQVCFGSASAVYGPELQTFLLNEVADWKTYSLMARRTGNTSASRILASIAADEKRHAKRLSTAYFLISGVRYWPESGVTPRLDEAMPALLRRRFQAEQKGEAAYRRAAESTQDPCLRELYLELAGDENSHGWLLRGILEEM